MINELNRHETESIDRLYLELAQFTKARTPREIQLNELLMAVESKYPDETRFETALRYIRQAERHSEGSEKDLSVLQCGELE